MHFGKTLIPPLMEYLNQHFLRIIKNDNSSVGLPIFIILCYEVILTENENKVILNCERQGDLHS